jgi:DNA polymerase III epsilon subunit-like protein
MSKKLCFVYTETNGLHQSTEDVSKKKIYYYARLVTLNYEIGNFKDNEFILEKKVRKIVKPRCMVISEDTIKYHGITQDYAAANGEDPEIVINAFKLDIKNIDIIVSHNVDFHFKTLLAEALKYNISIDFNNYIVIDTIDFYHQYGFLKLKDLAKKLHVKNIKEPNEYNVELIKNVFFKLYIKYKKSIELLEKDSSSVK